MCDTDYSTTRNDFDRADIYWKRHVENQCLAETFKDDCVLLADGVPVDISNLQL